MPLWFHPPPLPVNLGAPVYPGPLLYHQEPYLVDPRPYHEYDTIYCACQFSAGPAPSMRFAAPQQPSASTPIPHLNQESHTQKHVRWSAPPEVRRHEVLEWKHEIPSQARTRPNAAVDSTAKSRSNNLSIHITNCEHCCRRKPSARSRSNHLEAYVGNSWDKGTIDRVRAEVRQEIAAVMDRGGNFPSAEALNGNDIPGGGIQGEMEKRIQELEHQKREMDDRVRVHNQVRDEVRKKMDAEHREAMEGLEARERELEKRMEAITFKENEWIRSYGKGIFGDRHNPPHHPSQQGSRDQIPRQYDGSLGPSHLAVGIQEETDRPFYPEVTQMWESDRSPKLDTIMTVPAVPGTKAAPIEPSYAHIATQWGLNMEPSTSSGREFELTPPLDIVQMGTLVSIIPPASKPHHFTSTFAQNNSGVTPAETEFNKKVLGIDTKDARRSPEYFSTMPVGYCDPIKRTVKGRDISSDNSAQTAMTRTADLTRESLSMIPSGNFNVGYEKEGSVLGDTNLFMGGDMAGKVAPLWAQVSRVLDRPPPPTVYTLSTTSGSESVVDMKDPFWSGPVVATGPSEGENGESGPIGPEGGIFHNCKSYGDESPRKSQGTSHNLDESIVPQRESTGKKPLPFHISAPTISHIGAEAGAALITLPPSEGGHQLSITISRGSSGTPTYSSTSSNADTNESIASVLRGKLESIATSFMPTGKKVHWDINSESEGLVSTDLELQREYNDLQARRHGKRGYRKREMGMVEPGLRRGV